MTESAEGVLLHELVLYLVFPAVCYNETRWGKEEGVRKASRKPRGACGGQIQVISTGPHNTSTVKAEQAAQEHKPPGKRKGQHSPCSMPLAVQTIRCTCIRCSGEYFCLGSFPCTGGYPLAPTRNADDAVLWSAACLRFSVLVLFLS
jgi:hypothetical protein